MSQANNIETENLSSKKKKEKANKRKKLSMMNT